MISAVYAGRVVAGVLREGTGDCRHAIATAGRIEPGVAVHAGAGLHAQLAAIRNPDAL